MGDARGGLTVGLDVDGRLRDGQGRRQGESAFRITLEIDREGSAVPAAAPPPPVVQEQEPAPRQGSVAACEKLQLW